VTRRDIIAMLDDIVTRGAPIQANRTLEVVRKLFNWAVGRDLIQLNPCYRVPKPSSENRSDRVLSESEIRTVWNALSAEAPLTAARFKLQLLTAQRGAEVLTMRWDQIANGCWTIPAQFAKNGLAHRVPLSPQASALLDEIRPLGSGSPWTFPDADGEGHRAAIHKAHERIRRRSQVSFVPHDLRRTAASHMTSMGISRLRCFKNPESCREGCHRRLRSAQLRSRETRGTGRVGCSARADRRRTSRRRRRCRPVFRT
jgi:integrase